MILNISQNIRQTRSTFIIDGIAPNRAFTTTWSTNETKEKHCKNTGTTILQMLHQPLSNVTCYYNSNICVILQSLRITSQKTSIEKR